uniref:Uncharacterized AAA domain-containing protein ycf46 n=1 Tax=Halydictyon mirabile TaxID=189652 RepID=A0A4D6WWN0_9FLOR|nr:hypothetical protein [Halydictyon mirabile]
MNFEKELKITLSSRNPLIYILTDEEERLEYVLNAISQQIFTENIYTWDFINGYTNNLNYKNYAQKNPLKALDSIINIEAHIYLFKDFNFFINDLGIIRKLKNITKQLKVEKKYIIISSSEINIPDTLKEYFILINFPLPNKKEILYELNKIEQINKISPNISIDKLAIAYKGFSINKIYRSISKILLNQNQTFNILNHISEEKQKIIYETNILDLCMSNKKITDIAGLKNFKRWLKVRSTSFSQIAYNYGIPKPKGVLLVGVQGTGKSLSAKIISLEWQIPLLKLDISKIFNSILGESETKIKKMINICEQIAPCILWIDEIDKIFNSYKNNDSGTTNRVNNIFLTWLSEQNSNVFVVATANNINNLPAELLRKGRFDEIFFIDLPNFEERLNIFKIHLKNIRPLTWYQYNIYYLSQISSNFSGAEIEQIINDAMFNAFYANRECNTQDIIKSIENAIPLAITSEKQILRLQMMVKSGKIRPA